MRILACGHAPEPGSVFFSTASGPEVCRACWLDGYVPPTLATVVVVPHLETIEIDVRFTEPTEEAA